VWSPRQHFWSDADSDWNAGGRGIGALLISGYSPWRPIRDVVRANPAERAALPPTYWVSWPLMMPGAFGLQHSVDLAGFAAGRC
jgi:hypothetical protein